MQMMNGVLSADDEWSFIQMMNGVLSADDEWSFKYR